MLFSDHGQSVGLSANLLEFSLASCLNCSRSTAGLPPPGPPGRHLGHYPSLPPGYQNTSAPQNASSAMHPAFQAATQPYTQAPQSYQQVMRRHSLSDFCTVGAFCIHLMFACDLRDPPCTCLSRCGNAKLFCQFRLFGNLGPAKMKPINNHHPFSLN